MGVVELGEGITGGITAPRSVHSVLTDVLVLEVVEVVAGEEVTLEILVGPVVLGTQGQLQTHPLKTVFL